VNEAPHAGPEQVEQPAKQRSYQIRSHEMGLRHGYNIDNIQELLVRPERLGCPLFLADAYILFHTEDGLNSLNFKAR